MYYKGWRNEDTVLEGNCMDFCFFFSWYLYTGFLNSGQPVLCIRSDTPQPAVIPWGHSEGPGGWS